MIVTIQMKPAVARDLHQGRHALAESRHLHAIVEQLGLQLRAMHPGTADPDLASRFYVTTPNQQAAEEARRKIAESGVAEAVYVKPTGAPP